jgi:two-component system sensor histidine kinase HydH
MKRVPVSQSLSTTNATRVIMRPRRTALLITLVYASVSLVYFGLWGRVTATVATSATELARLESAKAGLFVLLTTLLIFALSYWLLKRLYLREQLLEAHRQALLAAERRAAAGLFAASVAHDLNNVLLITEYAISELDKVQGLPPRQERLVDELVKANDELGSLSRRLVMASGRHLGEEVRTVELAGFVHEIVKLAESHSKVRRCHVEVETPPPLNFACNPSLIHQMLLNLVINAGDATKHHGVIRVVLAGDDTRVTLEVHDNGPGIPVAERQRIFEPFFTTKADGTGLGLMSVKACAEVHHGHVTVQASPLGGACFVVEMCSMGRSAQQAASEVTPPVLVDADSEEAKATA